MWRIRWLLASSKMEVMRKKAEAVGEDDSDGEFLLVPVLCGRRIGYECWVFQYWS
jgi:hypothetical protein